MHYKPQQTICVNSRFFIYFFTLYLLRVLRVLRCQSTPISLLTLPQLRTDRHLILIRRTVNSSTLEYHK